MRALKLSIGVTVLYNGLCWLLNNVWDVNLNRSSYFQASDDLLKTKFCALVNSSFLLILNSIHLLIGKWYTIFQFCSQKICLAGKIFQPISSFGIFQKSILIFSFALLFSKDVIWNFLTVWKDVFSTAKYYLNTTSYHEVKASVSGV